MIDPRTPKKKMKSEQLPGELELPFSWVIQEEVKKHIVLGFDTPEAALKYFNSNKFPKGVEIVKILDLGGVCF